MINKINFFICFYEDDFDKIYKYFFNLRKEQDSLDILIKNNISFCIEKNKYSLIIYLFENKKIYNFYDTREN